VRHDPGHDFLIKAGAVNDVSATAAPAAPDSASDSPGKENHGGVKIEGDRKRRRVSSDD
jgi:hypothetical protein